MKLLGKNVLTDDELNEIRSEHLNKFEKEIREELKEMYENRIENLEKKNKQLNKTIDTIHDEQRDEASEHERIVTRLNDKISVLEEDRDDAREVIKREMELDDLNVVLEAKKSALDAREAKMKDREAKVDSQEESNYKKGYADGVSDGIRKISEITQKDRDGAMKVAMVAASSHTPVANLKELNNAHQLTAGSSDKEA